MNINHKNIRNNIFRLNYNYDHVLAEIIKDNSDHNFLVNPTVQLIYQYLTNYVYNISLAHFDMNPEKIKCLDWGAGKGHVTYYLKKTNMRIVSCDINRQDTDSSFGQVMPIIKYFNYKIDPLNHDYILPYDDETFNVAVSFGVLEHVNNDLFSLFELNRVLKNNGLLFIFNLPYKFSWTQNLAHLFGNRYHDKLYSHNDIKKLSKKSNFKIIDVWLRQLLPKNKIFYPLYNKIELIDLFLTRSTPLKYLATSIETLFIKNN